MDNDKKLYYTEYMSPVGVLTVAGTISGLTGLWLEGQKYHGADFLKSRNAEKAEGYTKISEIPPIASACNWLDIYFSGNIPDVTPPLSLSGTAFRLRVWKLLGEIPYGQTVSYGELARRLGAEEDGKYISPRAVGGAVGHNPVSIIVPCHRVTGADGNLCGYAGGESRKRFLIKLESEHKTCVIV